MTHRVSVNHVYEQTETCDVLCRLTHPRLKSEHWGQRLSIDTYMSSRTSRFVRDFGLREIFWNFWKFFAQCAGLALALRSEKPNDSQIQHFHPFLQVIEI